MNSCAGNFDSPVDENLENKYALSGLSKYLPGDGFLELVKLPKALDNRDVSSVGKCDNLE